MGEGPRSHDINEVLTRVVKGLLEARPAARIAPQEIIFRHRAPLETAQTHPIGKLVVSRTW